MWAVRDEIDGGGSNGNGRDPRFRGGYFPMLDRFRGRRKTHPISFHR